MHRRLLYLKDRSDILIEFSHQNVKPNVVGIKTWGNSKYLFPMKPFFHLKILFETSVYRYVKGQWFYVDTAQTCQLLGSGQNL